MAHLGGHLKGDRLWLVIRAGCASNGLVDEMEMISGMAGWFA